MRSSNKDDGDMNLGLVTYEELPNLSDGDRPLMEAFRRKGISAEPVSWDDRDVDWSAFSHLLVRSTWNYHRQPDRFRRWLDRIEALSVDLWNPPGLFRWNMTKTYLRDLVDRDVNVIPTEFVSGRNPAEWEEVYERIGSEEIVVKPVVGAGAEDTVRLATEKLRDFPLPGDHRKWLIQPYVEEITDTGEYSLIFIGDEFSHAVLKRPADGDYRVQTEHGGSVASANPAPDVVDQAGRILESVEFEWLYARVDGIVKNGEFILMELEMLEPNLYLEYSESAPSALVDAFTNQTTELTS